MHDNTSHNGRTARTEPQANTAINNLECESVIRLKQNVLCRLVCCLLANTEGTQGTGNPKLLSVLCQNLQTELDTDLSWLPHLLAKYIQVNIGMDQIVRHGDITFLFPVAATGTRLIQQPTTVMGSQVVKCAVHLRMYGLFTANIAYVYRFNLLWLRCFMVAREENHLPVTGSVSLILPAQLCYRGGRSSLMQGLAQCSQHLVRTFNPDPELGSPCYYINRVLTHQVSFIDHSSLIMTAQTIGRDYQSLSYQSGESDAPRSDLRPVLVVTPGDEPQTRMSSFIGNTPNMKANFCAWKG
ncbi:hypothetical protein BKA70DRAFT_1240760 [Coprinopsis sp. MPI-PUGE-AT-0042]|nr:hypothetical protein BKA70DRAFT_1240760 [Coprinopsis sp. MPI-PUGE-AT-0042]